MRHEGWKRLGSFPATIVGHLFSDVNFVDVEAAVERSYFFQSEISEYISTQQTIQFCKWLLDADFGPRINTLAETGKYPEFLIKNLRNIDRYRTLCVNLSEGQYVDAFHLWTAEVNGIQYFLTTDGKFIRAMTQSKNIELPCILISPEQLLEELEVKERLPFPHPENTTIDIFGNPV